MNENDWIWARWIALETGFKLKSFPMLRLLWKSADHKVDWKSANGQDYFKLCT